MQGGLIVAAIAVLVGLPSPAAAQVRDWNIITGGAYATAGNWNPANVPDTAAETAQFNLANSFRVTFNAGSSTTIDDLITSDGDVTFSDLGASDATLNISDDALIDGGDLTLAQFLTTGDVNLNIADLLLVGGSNTFSVTQGAAVTAATLDLGITGSGNGAVLVDGAGSSLVVAGTSRVGGFGKTGTLTFQNDSVGNSLGGLTQLIGSSGATNSTGRLNVLSGASLQTASILVGNSLSASAVQEGTLTVSGTNSLLTMTGASALTIGDETNLNIVADVIVSSGGQLDTGTGDILIRNSGRLNVTDGTFNANGNITIDRGIIERSTASGNFNLGAGLTLTAQNNAILSFLTEQVIDNGATFEINSGADFVVSDLNIGKSGDGSLTVDGAGSSATFGTLSLVANNVGASHATLTIDNDALVVTTGDVDIAASSGPDATTFATVQRGGQLTMNGASSLTIGADGAGVGQLFIDADSVLSTGSGTTTVGATGLIGGGGTFNINGDLVIDGGSVSPTGTASFLLASGSNVTIQNDGALGFGNAFAIEDGVSLTVNSGGHFSATQTDIGVNGDGTIIADGAPTGGGFSVITAGINQTAVWGDNGNTALVTLRNGSIGQFQEDTIDIVGGGASTAMVSVESDADMTFIGDVNINTQGDAGSAGTFTVTGAGSTVTMYNEFLTDVESQSLRIGQASNGTSTLNVLDGGTFIIRKSENGFIHTNVNPTGTINLDGGTMKAGSIDIDGGTFNFIDGILEVRFVNNDGGMFNFVGGLLSMVGTLHAGPGGLLGDNVTLGFNQSVLISGTVGTVVDSGHLLRLDGGSLTSKNLSVNGEFYFDRGMLEVAGGTISGISDLVVPANGEFRASGSHTLKITGEAGSTITATADLTLGDNSAVNGFYTNGTLRVMQLTTTLNDANDVVFDSASLVVLGDGAGGSATLAAANGLTLDFGGNLTGFGAVTTPNDPAKPLINNGHIAGNSSAEKITLPGYVKGVGTLDNVLITGTDAPGFSPAAVNRGSVSYRGALEIEIGGTTPGNDYDQLNHIMGAGIADLGGALDVSLINGFDPSVGDSYAIITASGSVTGEFDAVSLPALDAGEFWKLDYQSNSLTLNIVDFILGDMDGDGLVNLADVNPFVESLTNRAAYDLHAYPTNTDAAGDVNLDGTFDMGDIGAFAALFGSPANAQAVPEPSALLLSLCAVPLLFGCGRKKSSVS